MAKTIIYCDCGGKIVVEGRNRRDADSRASKLQGTAQCEACRRREFDRMNQEALAASAGLPLLTGSAKQVPWAATIRLEFMPLLATAPAEMLPPLLDGLADLVGPDLLESARLEMSDAIALIVAEMRENTDAGWWIDKRGGATKDGVAWLIKQEFLRRQQFLTPTIWAAWQARQASRK